MGGKVGLERISGWMGKARLNDHLLIPKSERKLITLKKRWESNPAKEKKQGAKTRVLQ